MADLKPPNLPSPSGLAQGVSSTPSRSTVGPFSFTRNGPAGRLSAIGDGNHTVAYTPDAQGRLARRTDVVGGVTIYDVVLTYDASGRVPGQVETVAGAATTLAYARNADQQLASVSRTNHLSNVSQAWRDRRRRAVRPSRPLREAILNAIIHRDYAVGAPILLRVVAHVLFRAGPIES